MKNNLSDLFYGIINGIRIATSAITIGLMAGVFFIPPILAITLIPKVLAYSLVCAASNMWYKSLEKERNFQKVLNRIAMLKEMGYSIEIEFENQEMLDYYFNNPHELNKLVDQLIEVADMPDDEVDVEIGVGEDGEMEFLFKDEKASESLIQLVIQRAKQIAEEQGIELTDEEIKNAINNVQEETEEDVEETDEDENTLNK